MKKKFLLLLALALAFVLAFAACNRGNGDEDVNDTTDPIVDDTTDPVETDPVDDNGDDYEGDDPPVTADVGPRTASGFQPLSTLPADAEGEVTVLTGGNHGLFMDIGNNPPEFTAANWSTLRSWYYSAKAFQELYPNIRINVMSVDFFKNASEIAFSQGMINAYAQYGMLPDVWETHSLVLHVLQGEASDLSRFENEASFQVFNPYLMNMMNYYGFQGGVPGWISPWAIGVNIDLAESLNIDIPPLNWTLDQYADFISNADMVNMVGDVWTAGFLVELAARDVSYSALHTGRVNLDTPEVRHMLDIQHRIGNYTLWSAWPDENVANLIESFGWSEGAMFAGGASLATIYAGWQYTAFANPAHNDYMPGRWDLWPLPGSAESGPTISTVLDPVVIRNFEGHPNADHQLDITWAFTAFHYGSLEGWNTRFVEGRYVLGEDAPEFLGASNHTSWPGVREPYFSQQMEVWYEGNGGGMLRDLPGFNKVLQLYLDGHFWNLDSRTFPGSYFEDGVQRGAFEGWSGRESEDVAGVPFSDPAWPDRVKARLGEWTESANIGLERARQELRDALTQFYGITDFS